VAGRNRERFWSKWTADLAHQEPPGTTVHALERAFRATERRAAAVAAAGPLPAARRPARPTSEDEVAGLRREQELLLRDLGVKDAFIQHAECLLADATASRERLEAEGVRAQRALAEGHQAAVDLHRAHVELVAAHEALAIRQAAAEAELQALRTRAAALDAIVNGGWWRLRSRVLPLLALARFVRGVLRRRA
jgi:hypothetical protein